MTPLRWIIRRFFEIAWIDQLHSDSWVEVKYKFGHKPGYHLIIEDLEIDEKGNLSLIVTEEYARGE